jgi:hypothetical protein
MSLIICKECNKEYSQNAKTCPHCGDDKTSPSILNIAYYVAITLFAIFIVTQFINASKTSTYRPATQQSHPDDGKQAKRLELTNKLISSGIFYKVDKQPQLLPRLYVDSAFYNLNIDDKKLFTRNVFLYYFISDSTNSILFIRDKYTGKDIGTYSERGLDLN